MGALFRGSLSAPDSDAMRVQTHGMEDLFKMKRKLALLLTFPMVISMAGCSKSDSESTVEESNTVTSGDAVQSGSDAELETLSEEEYAANAVYSDNFAYTQAEMTYLYNNVVQQYSSYLSYYGVDTTTSLKEQEYEEGTSWFDMFMDQAKSYAEQYLYFCEEANARGIELSEENQDLIDESMENLTSTATNAGYDNVDDYLQAMAGPAVTSDVMRSYLQKYYLGYQMYDTLQKSHEFSADEVEEYYENNAQDYQYVDYVYYAFTADEDLGITADMCQDYMQQAAKAKDIDLFEKIVNTFLEEKAKLEEENSTESTDESGETADETTAEAYTAEPSAHSYTADSEISEWAFADDTKVNGTYTVTDEDNGTYTVYMLTAKPYRDETKLKNVRHILFTASEYGSDDEAKAKAEEVLKQWKSGDATEDSFAELADEYSADGAEGGLYENVTEGQMVNEFNDWLFDDARKAGDTDIVQTTYGYHVMYFVGDGEEQWYSTVSSAMLSEAMEEEYNVIKDKYTLTVDDDVLNTVQEVL